MTPVVKQGSEVLIRAYVYDLVPIPKVLFDPDYVKFTLIAPDGTHPNGDNVAMTKTAVGIYQSTYQTASDAPLGIWSVELKTENGADTVLRPRSVAFNLITP